MSSVSFSKERVLLSLVHLCLLQMMQTEFVRPAKSHALIALKMYKNDCLKEMNESFVNVRHSGLY